MRQGYLLSNPLKIVGKRLKYFTLRNFLLFIFIIICLLSIYLAITTLYIYAFCEPKLVDGTFIFNDSYYLFTMEPNFIHEARPRFA